MEWNNNYHLVVAVISAIVCMLSITSFYNETNDKTLYSELTSTAFYARLAMVSSATVVVCSLLLWLINTKKKEAIA